MFDLFCKSGCNEVLLNEGVILEGALAIHLQKFQLLGNVGALLVVLMVLMHVSEEAPVVEVIDGILEEGICCSVAPEMAAEPGG